MRKVVVVQEVLPQYRVPLFERLRQGLAEHGVELVLVHGQGTAAYRARQDGARLDWARVVRNTVIPLPRGATVTWQPAVRQAMTADLVVVEHANRHLTNYVLLAIQAVGGGPRVAFWGHGANLQSRRPDGFREQWKALTARRPHWWFAYTEGSAERVAARGFPRARITVVQNAVDTAAFRADNDVLRDPHGCVCVASLYPDKRIGFLLEAGDLIAAQLPTFALTMVGDGPQRDRVVAAARTRPWLRYAGAAFGGEKATLVRASTLMLNPGLVGLAVLDAFAARTPMMTVAGAFHSPEFEYLVPDRNGIVLPEGTTPASYASGVLSALSDVARLEGLRRGCAQASHRLSLSEMHLRFHNGLLKALASAAAGRR